MASLSRKRLHLFRVAGQVQASCAGGLESARSRSGPRRDRSESPINHSALDHERSTMISSNALRCSAPSRRVQRVLAATAAAFFSQALPAHAGDPQRLDIIIVADPQLDQIYELRDWNLNGSWNDPVPDCEVIYSSAGSPLALVEPVVLTIDPDDAVYVGDTALDRIIYINDIDGSGDLSAPGELAVYFDGTTGGNASGVRLARMTGLDLAFLGFVWASSTRDALGEGEEAIYLLRDQNADGDANDSGEAQRFHQRPAAPAGTHSISTLCLGVDNRVYFVDNGTTPGRGVWRSTDLNGDGDADDAGETTLFWSPPTSAAAADWTGLDQDEDGAFHVADRLGRQIWRIRDDNGNGLIDGLEARLFWTLDPAAQFTDIGVARSGAVYVPDSRANQRILQGVDLDASFDVDPSEALVGYSDLVSPTDIDEAAGVAMDFHGHEEVGTPFCDGTSGLCPCGNNGGPGRGCTNSTGAGAGLEGAETDGITNDDLELTVFNVRPGASVLLFFGTGTVGGGFGTPFGDGLRCVGGSVTRVGVQFADATGSLTYGPGLAAQYGWSVGQTVYFQGWYRNVQGPCGGGFNLTNGLQVTFSQ